MYIRLSNANIIVGINFVSLCQRVIFMKLRIRFLQAATLNVELYIEILCGIYVYTYTNDKIKVTP